MCHTWSVPLADGQITYSYYIKTICVQRTHKPPLNITLKTVNFLFLKISWIFFWRLPLISTCVRYLCNLRRAFHGAFKLMPMPWSGSGSWYQVFSGTCDNTSLFKPIQPAVATILAPGFQGAVLTKRGRYRVYKWFVNYLWVFSDKLWKRFPCTFLFLSEGPGTIGTCLTHQGKFYN